MLRTPCGSRSRGRHAPGRRKLVARWTYHGTDPTADTGQDEATHPAVVALRGELEARGLGSNLASLRQISIVGDEGPIDMELALTMV
ncbi:MAG: hypothetical protein ACRDRH_08735 [Pseudonocardia sp.]